MRRLLAILLSLSLLLGAQTSAHAQTAAYAEVSSIDAGNFPRVSALLDVYGADGAFISGLQPSDLVVYEDGNPRRADTLTESAVPAQIVVAVNPGPSLAVRDSNGTPRFDFVVNALGAWATTVQSSEPRDDLSLVSLSGVLISHASPADWLVSLQSFKPDFRNSTPNIQTLSIALDAAAAPTRQPGMKRAVFFITPRLDDPNIDNTLAPFIQKAVESKIRVFVWFVDAADFNTSPSANAFRMLAQQTNGAFFSFSGTEPFPDPAAYFAPLRHIYSLTYTSGLTTGGGHRLGLYVETAGGTIPALDRAFSVDVQPPNPIFVAPPSQITRQPPADDPYNPDILVPARQELEVIVEFPDGHLRDIERVTLYIDGEVAAENTAAPFEKFIWDLEGYTQSGQHTLMVEVEDSLGLTKSSITTTVNVTVIHPPTGVQVMLARYRSQIVLGAIGLAGIALLAILLRSRRRGNSTIDRIESRKRFEDPLTQPVAALGEPTVPAAQRVKTQPRKPITPGWASKNNRVEDAPAYLTRLTNGGEPASAAPIPLAEKDMTFGTDPVQSLRVLDDPSIAPLHARIRQVEPGVFTIHDQGSVAGTWVNYEPVTREGRRLRHGDRIHFGGMVYRFELKQVPAESEPQVIRK